MKLLKLILLLAAAGVVLSHAQSADLARADRQFFEKAALSGMKEVGVSSAVLGKLTDPEAKAFAQMMVADHTAANEKLKTLAAKKGVTLPPDDPKPIEKWTRKDKDVDDDYWDEMVSDHRDAVELFEKGSNSRDPEIAAFAAETLPKLRHHLEMAKARRGTM